MTAVDHSEALAARLAKARTRRSPESTIPARPDDVPAELSGVQRQLWFLHQWAPDSAAYHLPIAWRLRGSLSLDRLGTALSTVVERHEILRTRYVSHDGEPALVIDPPRPIDVPVVPAGTDLDEQLRELARVPFALDHDWPLRATLLRHGADDHTLLLLTHHIAVDGWSVGLLASELSAAYAEHDGDRPNAGRPVQYADLTHHLRDRDQSAAEAYWQQRLADFDEPVLLPADRPRTATPADDGAMFSFLVDERLSPAIRALAASERASGFMLTLAAFAALCARYTDTDDLVIGVPVGGRDSHPAAERVIGCFVNTMPVRIRVADGVTGRALLREVRTGMLADSEHSGLPYARIVGLLDRSSDNRSLYELQCVATHVPRGALTLPGVEVTDTPVDPEATKVDLSLAVADLGGPTIEATITFRRGLFDAETVERFAGHLRRLLAAITADPDAALADLDLLGDGERALLTAPPSAPAADHGTILDRIDRWVRDAPDRPAVVGPDGTLTYAQLDVRSRVLAARLAAAGAGPDAVVAVDAERSVEFLVGIVAILRAGAAYLPLEPGQPASRHAAVRDAAGARLHVGELTCAGGSASPVPEIDPASLAYVIFTSGSTGQPKGVAVEHRALMAYLDAVLDRLRPDQGATFGVCSTLAADLGHTMVFGALYSGGTLHIIDAQTALDPEAFARRASVDFLKMVPSQLAALLSGGEAAVLPKTCLVLGGEALSGALVEEVRALRPDLRIVNHYGPTETTVGVVTYEVCGDHAGRTVPLGTPLPHVAARVLDRAGRPVPIGVPGELSIAGAGLARGYLGAPELTAERFVHAAGERRYRTGDRVRFLADGTLEFLGRVDRQVKIRGHRVEPGEVEAALRAHPAVRDAAVLAIDGRLVAYAAGDHTTSPGPALDARRLSDWLAERLPSHLVPSLIIPVPALPLTPNGKLDRAALRLPAPAVPAVPSSPAAAVPAQAMSATQSAVSEVFAAVLGIDPPGVDGDFFALGGHSLLAVRVVSRLRRDRAAGVTLPVLFAHPTVGGLAAYLTAHETGQATRALAPPSAAPPGPAVLSPVQRRLWFLDRALGADPVYNLPYAIRITGRLDTARLQAALSAIVARHDALRTTFPEIDGAPVPTVSAPQPFPLPIGEVGDEEAARQEIDAEFRTGFDLATGPVIRARLLRRGEIDHILLLTVHHIAFDGWSYSVFQDELSAGYAGVPVPAPPVSYAQYARWQRGLDHARDLAYWQSALAGAPAGLDLPSDRARPARLGYRGAAVPVSIPADVTAALDALARELGATRFMILLAAFQVFLARHTDARDIVVGTPVAGRSHPELEKVLGCFVNMVPMRSRVDLDMPFREFLGEVRKTVLAGLEHCGLPFEDLVAATGVPRDPSRHPVFGVLFVLQNTPKSAAEPPGLTLAAVDGPTGVAKYDLSLILTETADGLRGAFEYSSALFDEATVARFAERFAVLLAGAVAAPEAPLAELPVATPAELRSILVDWNDTAVEFPPLTVLDLIEAQVRQRSEAVAVSDRTTSLTYAQLDAAADRLTGLLRAEGVGPGSLVAVAVDRTVRLPVALLGVLRAGAAYVPLDASHPADRLAYVLADSGASVLVSDVPMPPFDGPVVDPSQSADPLRRAGAVRPGAEDPAYVIYTSGSTGRPKGVVVSHGALANFLLAMAREPGLTSADSLLAVTTPAFDIAGLELFLPLTVGARVVIAARTDTVDGAALARRIADERVTCLQATPVTWRLLLSANWDGDAGLTALCGGEALPADLAAALRPRVKALWNMYGPTEATIWATMKRIDGPGGITVGRPIANLTAHVVDEHDHAAPVGVAGELLLGGAGLATRYHRRPELTEERFTSFRGERVYRTGDVARWRADGELELLGRRDSQIKLRGYRIEIEEIEAVLAEHPGVRQAGVAVRPDGVGEPRLVAYVVGSADGAREFLAARLPGYMVPSAFVELEALPTTPNGKLDRAALPEPASEPVRAEAVAWSDDPAVGRVARIFAEVVGQAAVGPDDDFFAVGGDSLRAVRAVRLIDPSLSVLDLFAYPTPRALAERLARDADRTRILHRLASGTRRTVVAVPFGGASAIVYADLAARLPRGWGLCAVQPPGRDPAHPDEPDMPLEQLADAAAAAVLAEVDGPVVLYGHCVGAALATAIGQRLAAAGRPAELLVVAAAFPVAGLPGVWNRIARLSPDRRLSDRAVTDGLRALGGLADDLPDTERRLLARAVRHDADQAEQFYARPPAPVGAPVLVVVGEQDLVTRFHDERAGEWAAYGTAVQIAVLPDAEHFFQHDRRLAELLEAGVAAAADPADPAASQPSATATSPHRPAPPPPGTTARFAAFLAVTAGQLVSLIGTGLSTFALGVWAYLRTGSVQTMTAIAAFTLVPAILAGPLAGAVADRCDRRRVMICCDLAALAASGAAAGLFLAHALVMWHLYALITVGSLAGVFRQPAYAAAVTQLVPKRFLGHANGLVGLGSGTGAIVAQLAGGAVMATVGLGGALWIDVASFAVAFGTLVAVRFPDLGFVERDGPLIREVLAGWRYITGRRALVAVVVFFAVGNALSGVVLVLVTPLVLAFGSPATLGVVLAAQGAGLFAGSAVMAAWGGTRRRTTGMVAFVGLFAASAVVIGLRPLAVFPMLGMFGVGMAAALINAHWLALVQVRVGLRLQGRVLATAQMLARLATPVGYAVTGPLADRVFEPAATRPGSLFGRSLGVLIGTGPGRGMAALVMLTGLAVGIWALVFSRYRPIQELEDDDVH